MFQLEKIYKDWSLKRITRHVIYWMAWLLFYVITNSTHQDTSVWNWIQIELTVMLVKLPFTYFTIYFLVPQFLFKKKNFQFFITFLVSAMLGGLLLWAIYYVFINPYYFDLTPTYFCSPKIGYKVVDLIYISCIPTIIKMYQRQAFQEKQATQLVEQKLGAELKLLKNQLHPHFLFNTLNNLYSMILIRHDKAADVVVRLSDMMSYMLYECEQPFIDLDKEITNLQNYIELEKIRYGKRLDLSFETGGAIQGKMIAPLLLLPFFENAFKHGAEKNEKISWVRINLWVTDNELTFLIENSMPEKNGYDATSKLQSGVGLVNVKKRLELLYPENHILTITEEDSFLVKLNLKLNDEVPDR